MKLRLAIVIAFAAFAALVVPPSGGVSRVRTLPPQGGAANFLAAYCAGCHNAKAKKGNLDLTALTFAPADADNLRLWVRIHDRVAAGEMPPKGAPRPEANEVSAFVSQLAADITAYERQAAAENGRAARRRLNSYEYEYALRGLFRAPWLQIRSRLPEDGEAYRFNKSAEALDVSHVLLARYMKAADYAMRQVISTQLERPPTATQRHYAREQRSMTGFPRMQFTAAVDKRPFPLLDLAPQPLVRERRLPATVGATDPATREREAVGWVMSAFAPGVMYAWDGFRAPVAGRYRVRPSGYTVWVGPAPDGVDKDGKVVSRKHLPNYDDISRGRRRGFWRGPERATTACVRSFTGSCRANSS